MHKRVALCASRRKCAQDFPSEWSVSKSSPSNRPVGIVLVVVLVLDRVRPEEIEDEKEDKDEVGS
jgi:hypothetical protein